MIGIRGAIASVENSEENILESSKILFTEIIEQNNLAISKRNSGKPAKIDIL